MGIKRFMLRPVAHIAGSRAMKQARAFLGTHRYCREVQDRLLKQMLHRCRDTDFARDHNFHTIDSYEDFVSAVPVRPYEQLQPYFDSVFNGRPQALLPADEPILMFSMTSGTTGHPKHIPVTKTFLDHMRRGFNIFGILALNDHKDAWLRRILQVSSPMCETASPDQIACGAISGLLAASQFKIIRRMYPVPLEVASIADPIAKYYTIMRCGISSDVAFITTANPSSVVKLIETAQQHTDALIRDIADGTITPPGQIEADILSKIRFKANKKLAARLESFVKADGQLLPGHFWNLAFLANWTGGTLRLYIKRLRELFGDVPIRDIGLIASEGRFSIPISDNTSAGIAEITSNFLEFIPAEQRESENPPVLRAHELDVGQEYFLVVSNHAGLWRYNIDDRIRVVDRYERSPVFEFLCRGLHTANLTGEKITEHQVVEAMRRASRQKGIHVDCFLLQPVFAACPYYKLQVEPLDGADMGCLAREMDKYLSELNMEYRSKRESGRLGAIRTALLEPGQLKRMELDNIRSRRGLSEQYKHKYLLTEVEEEQ